MNKKDIDYALVEEVRPPLYTAMKYWGKKPHNIWRQYIATYTENEGIFLDPFSGSAMSAFEAVKVGKKAIAFDLNPLTSFLIEVYCSKYDDKKFIEAVNKIINLMKQDSIYKKYFHTKCRECGSDSSIIQNAKWEKGKIYEIGVICNNCEEGKEKRYIVTPDSIDINNSMESNNIIIDKWFPKDEFYKSPSFTKNFINKIGGTNFGHLWTKRNLYVLSCIFDLILKEKDSDLQKQLVFGFLQTVHLCSKMCVPRREKANRAFSTSWGRAAYICSDRQMEMNALLLFESSCIGKQSVQSALKDIKKYIGKIPKIKYVDENNKNDNDENYDIKYGTVDINKITEYIAAESVSFILTDPPYGGLVQYLDLSQIWLVWLKKIDKRYCADIEAEITIKKDIQDITEYNNKFTNGIKNIYKVLKPDGKIVFTFHNKDLKIWNAFLRSIAEAGFKIEKVIHQQNRRTGESNVSNPYGSSASDFYIRCSKSEYVKNVKTTRDEFENFIIGRAVSIIESRGEPTPYQILFNGLLSEISKAGFDLEDFDDTIKSLLSKHIGKVFILSENFKNEAGKLWWVLNPKTQNKNVVPLSNRVEKTVYKILEHKKSVTLDEVLAEIFINFPNELTPDIKTVDSYVKKLAYKSGSKWIYKKKGSV